MEKYNNKVRLFLPEKELEKGVLEQVDNMSTMPFVKGIAVMADAHVGKGCSVGSVIATHGAVIPATVGVDIGCGMIAVRTKFSAKDLPDNLDGVRTGIERRIPLGAGGRNQKLTKSSEGYITSLLKKANKAYKEAEWQKQLGSLGSGNHFIELSLDENDTLWVVLHSGSRGIGNRLATKHIKVAQQLMEKYFISLKDADLAYLSEGTAEFKDYIEDLLWSQDYALANREEMMDRVMTELSYLFYHEDGHQKEIEKERINCHHNFTQKEYHMGHNVWLTRKGAIQMREGQMGVIPGSMGTRSYIVSGLQNILAYHSAPHGAGRRFSRNEARKRFTMEDMSVQMEGVVYRHEEALLDEIPACYKDIDLVMEHSKELVKVKHVLKQIVNVKGN